MSLKERMLDADPYTCGAEWFIAFRDGSQQYIACGSDPACLPVYEVDGDPLKPTALYRQDMTYPACFRFLQPTVTLPLTRRRHGNREAAVI